MELINPSRRGFLKLFTASIVSIATPTVIAGVVVDPYFKYKKALQMYDEAKLRNINDKTISAEIDKVFRFIDENFTKPTYSREEYEACEAMLYRRFPENETLETMVRKVPSPIMEAIWPIALMKTALSVDNLKLNPSHMKEFDNFHDLYGKLIIGVMDKEWKKSLT